MCAEQACKNVLVQSTYQVCQILIKTDTVW